MSFLIMARTGDVPLFPLDVVRAGAGWWTAQGGEVTVFDRPGDLHDLIIAVQPATAGRFQIRRDSTGRALSTDGTPAQVADVGVWARSQLLPDDPTEVWLVDQGYTQHVVLSPGITADVIERSWAPIQD
jgi:hypothetical protein